MLSERIIEVLGLADGLRAIGAREATLDAQRCTRSGKDRPQATASSLNSCSQFVTDSEAGFDEGAPADPCCLGAQSG